MKLLSYNNQGLDKFPGNILNHLEVTNLNLNDNEIEEIPDWIIALQNLKVLYLNNNQLTNFEILCELPQLEVLHLNENQIKAIPERISQLKNLKRLYLNHNLITDLPYDICELSQLKQLLLAHNQLIELPQNIGNLTRLNSLILFHNRLESIPHSISSLQNLDYLQLGFNSITNLPETIINLKSLTTLDIFSNQLHFLPESFQKTPSITHLNVADNFIEHLASLPLTLRELSIYNNPVQTIDNQIIHHFKTIKFDFFEYLFIDTNQAQKFGLKKDDFGRVLRIVDLENKRINPWDFKYMPIELQKKWNLKEVDF